MAHVGVFFSLMRSYYEAIAGAVIGGAHPLTIAPAAGSEPGFGALLERGILEFLDLSGLPSYEARLPEGVTYHRLPLMDLEPPTEDEVEQAVGVIKSAIDRRRSIYVHCYAGRGRTGVIIGCLLLELGLAATGDQALDQVQDLFNSTPRGRQALARGKELESPEGRAQEAVILAWADRVAHGIRVVLR